MSNLKKVTMMKKSLTVVRDEEDYDDDFEYDFDYGNDIDVGVRITFLQLSRRLSNFILGDSCYSIDINFNGSLGHSRNWQRWKQSKLERIGRLCRLRIDELGKWIHVWRWRRGAERQSGLWVSFVPRSSRWCSDAKTETVISFDNKICIIESIEHSIFSFKNGTRSSLTFSNQRVRDIERDNQNLLKKIMKHGPSGDGVSNKPESTVSSSLHLSQSML